jgi:hypothetical protein
VRLQQAGSVDAALQNIRNLQISLGNSRSGLTGSARRSEMLRWLDDQARPVLEFLFGQGADVLAEIHSSYERLAGSGLEDTALYSLATRENTRWPERVKRIEDEPRRQSDFAGRPGSPVITDTSVLMEAGPLGAIDLKVPAPVRLLVPIVVVEELDELLHDRDADRRKRARDARRILMTAHPDGKATEPAALPGTTGITLEVLLDSDARQRRANNDAEIVKQARAVHGITGQAVLATCDLAQYYRAGPAGLAAVLVPRRADQQARQARQDRLAAISGRDADAGGAGR